MKKQAKRKDKVASIPEDLNALLGSLKALATTHHLLRTGAFTFEYRDAISSSIQYVEALHKQVLSEAQAHPEAHLVPQFSKKPISNEEHAAQDQAFAEVLEQTIQTAQEVQ